MKESIQSILPLVDEFVVALGNCDEDDNTLEEIQSIGSDKIKIIHTVWDLEKYPNGTEYARQTDIAKNECKGDWLFYLQSDEVIHEKYLPVIKKRCEAFLHDKDIEGLLFDYKHFWGDYDHYIESHGWYAKEIRIIRNLPYIHSWGDAQSFRNIPDFDGVNYHQKKGTYKLRVAGAGAWVYHYGWVRPPRYMQTKQKAFTAIYKGNAFAENNFGNGDQEFNFGNLDKLNIFNEKHPKVMENMINRFDWQDKLHPNISPDPRVKHKHEKLKNRLLSYVEKNLLNGNQIFSFKNYTLVKR
ncbi:glycosyltransferase family 2 protein [Agriterribacter sp.]|uniref:glycosyltransferase family 2 protein n=1 Tax=Agriterribacter sp. TaxID=2821509 RepID=UPI002C38557A|nr:glycosyltransferase family 2 protein [Agriterribacter sp.]HRP56467.1 glycosyltransferase family 2 protein [Agriterribacter sp.]